MQEIRKGGQSRRQAEIIKINKDKNHLRSQWLKDKQNENEELKLLYEEVKKKLRNAMRK